MTLRAKLKSGLKLEPVGTRWPKWSLVFLEVQAGKVFRRDPGECFGKLLPSSGSGNRQQDNCQGNGKVSLWTDWNLIEFSKTPWLDVPIENVCWNAPNAHLTSNNAFQHWESSYFEFYSTQAKLQRTGN